MENKITRPQLPSKAFDFEYATQYRKEMEYLRSRGFEYTFMRLTPEYKVPTYKYTKTPELFRAVADFYEQRALGKEFEDLSSACDEATKKQICLDAIMKNGADA